MIDLEAIRARDAADMEVLPSLEAYAQHVDDEELRNAIHMVRDRRDLLAYVDALRAAAGKVTCLGCHGTGCEYGGGPCPDCTPLRALIKEAGQ